MKYPILTLALTLLLSFLSHSISAQIPPYVSTDGLVGWWPFDNHPNDLSGNNLNGIPANVTPTTDRYNEENMAYQFNGSSSSIRVPNHYLFNFSSQEDFTWSVWLRPDNNLSNTPEAGVITKWNEQLSQGYPYTIRLTDLNNGYSQVLAGNYFAYSGAGNANVSGGLLLHGHYVHVVLRVQSNVSQLFINNELVSSVGFINGAVNNAFDLYFGRRFMHNSRWYKGAMDDAGLWNRALTDTEIAGLYFSIPLNMTEHEGAGILRVYPNPSNFYFTLTTSNNLVGNNYQLFNALGKLVKLGRVEAENTLIEISDLPRGTYFLKVEEELAVHKVLKL